MIAIKTHIGELFLLGDSVKIISGLTDDEPRRYFIEFVALNNPKNRVLVFESVSRAVFEGVMGQLHSLLRVRGLSLIDFKAMEANKGAYDKFKVDIDYTQSEAKKKEAKKKQAITEIIKQRSIAKAVAKKRAKKA